MALLKRLPQTLILATHDLNMALELSNRVILLNHGQLVVDGASKDILLNEDILQQNDLF